MVKQNGFSRILSILLILMMVVSMVPQNFGSNVYADATPYEISSAEDFANMPADGNCVLMNDIEIDTPYATAFTGTFDGGGNVITLNINSTAINAGLFGTVGSNAIVKNLILEGSVTNTANNTGAVAGTISGDATIENCLNKAGVSGKSNTAGIVGMGYGNFVVKSCANEGHIIGSAAKEGGIVGSTEAPGTIRDCYNRGEITGINQFGGILGRGSNNSLTISNCYNVGAVTKSGSNNGYAIVGAGGGTSNGVAQNPVVSNCYSLYDIGADVNASGNIIVESCEYRTAADMKAAAFAELLGNAFEAVSDGYPELVGINNMQIPKAKAVFTVSPEDATLTVAGKNVSGGSSRKVNLLGGDYTWEASREGYVTQTGNFSVSDSQASNKVEFNVDSVTLGKDPSMWNEITFVTDPADATIVVKQGETTVEPTSGKTYDLLNTKTYKYIATSETEGYEVTTGDVDLNSATNSVTLKRITSIAVTGNETSYYQGTTETELKETLTVTASFNQGADEVVTDYTVSDFNSSAEVTGQVVTITYKGQTATFTINITPKPGPIEALEGKATVELLEGDTYDGGKYGFAETELSGERVLKSNNNGVTGKESKGTMIVTPNRAGTISFKWKSDSEARYDYLRVYIDNYDSWLGNKGDWSGKNINGEWNDASYNLSPGQKLYLTYEKDNGGNDGTDSIYLKDFRFRPLPTITITPSVEGVTIVLKDSEGAEITGINGVYIVESGKTYTYTVTKFGYEEATGSVTATNGDVTKTVTMTQSAGQTVTFNLTRPDGISDETIVVKHGLDVMTETSHGTYSLVPGTYSYEITHPNCKKVTGTLTVESSAVTENVALVAISSLAVAGNKASYYIGTTEETLRGEITVTATYTDSTTETVTGYNVAGFDVAEATDSATITISYMGKNATFRASFAVKPGPLDALTGKATINLLAGEKGGTAYGFEQKEVSGEKLLTSTNKDIHSSSAIMTITPNHAGVIGFSHKISTEQNYDFLYVYVGLGNKPSSYKESTQEVKERWSGNRNWTPEEFKVAAGETLYIEYEKDSSTSNFDDTVYLRDFTFTQLPALTISTPNVAEATIEVKDSGDNVIPGSNGVFVVEAGTYSYTVSKHGYETATGIVTVGEDDVTQTVNLVAVSGGKTVTFTVHTPTGMSGTPVVSVKYNGSAMDPSVPGQYTLVEGDYTYTIELEGCEKIEGNFTIGTEDIAIEKTLVKILTLTDFIPTAYLSETPVNDAEWPFKGFYSEDGNYLESTASQSSKISAITLKFNHAATLSFDYALKAGTSSYYGLYVEKNGSKVGDTIYGEKDWTNYSISVKSGDSIKINFKRTYSSGDYYARLKNFAVTPLQTVTFANAPSGTSFEIKKGDEVVASGSEVAYNLPDGNYTYTATCFGYVDKTDGSFTVNGAACTVDAAMTAAAGKTVTFNITKPEGIAGDPTITVKHGYNTMEPVSTGTYNLTAADYTYTIRLAGCDEIAGEFTVSDSDITITKNLLRTLTLDDFIDSTYLSSKDNSGNMSHMFKGVYNEAGTAGEYLQADFTQTYGQAYITLVFNVNATLSFDYYVKANAYSSYGFFVEQNNKKVLQNIYSDKDWTNYTINVLAGDTVKISMYSGSDKSSIARLRNFSIAPSYTVNVTNIADGATFVLTKGEAVITPSSAGIYVVPNGTYSYTESKFGFNTLTGTVAVNDADQNVVLSDMTAAASKTLTFAVPDGASVTVTHAMAGDMSSFASGNVFTLPVGETYSYSITKADYVPVSGTVDLTDNKTLTIELQYAGVAWDGTTKTAPSQDTDGTYLISNGAELAWFADYVNNTSGNVNAKLTADINLNGKTWTPIGGDKAFEGTFDGNGKTVSGLKAASYGLFDTVGTESNHDAIVKNLSVNGSIAGSAISGGIAATVNGIIENCSFSGTITSSGTGGTGGIAGRMNAGGRISGCGVNATITNTNEYFAQTLNVGGIVGYMYGVLENSYFIGNVSAKKNHSDGRTLTNKGVAGLTYKASKAYGSEDDAVIRNCYVSAIVTGPTDGIAAFMFEGNAIITNCYYENKGLIDSKATAKTASEMKARNFVAALNGSGNAFNQDTTNINSGYPVLAWQGGAEVEDEDATAVSLDKATLEIGVTKVSKAGTLPLPTSGDNGTTISWSSNNTAVISNNGVVTLPETGIARVTLTATVRKGDASDTKEFTIEVYSKAQVRQDKLDAIAASQNGKPIWASEIVHPEETNTVDVIKRYIAEAGYNINGLTVTMTSPGTKATPLANQDVNIKADGTIEYFKGANGSSSYHNAQYNDVAFTVSNGSESASFTCIMFISWDKEYVEQLLEAKAATITWDSIRGENVTSSAVTSSITLPTIIDNTSVTWGADYDYSEGIMVDFEEPQIYTQKVNFIRPVGNDLDVTLIGNITFNLSNDEVLGESNLTVTKRIPIKVLKDESQTTVDVAKTQQDLDANLIELVKYRYSDVGEDLNLSAVKGDLAFPAAPALQKSGILQNRSNQKVVYTSLTPEIVVMNGSNATVYRPLPGEADTTAKVKIEIFSRDTNVLQASKVIEFTVKAFTQAEINADKTLMGRFATDAVYWEGLSRGTGNVEKSKVVGSLKGFSYITTSGSGLAYANMIGDEQNAVILDDLPGYDSMGSQSWRIIRSSRPTVITDENVLLTRPEYDTELVLDSCMTFKKYEAYGDRYAAEPTTYASYSIFNDFYKVPVKAEIVALGLNGADPEAATRPKTMSVTVKVDGKGFGNFENITAYTYEGATNRDHSAWDALEAAFTTYNYTYEGNGSYISSVTDAHGHKLAHKEYGDMSGWMYYIDSEGNQPDLTLSQYYLTNGENMVFYYSGEKPVTPVGPSGGGSSTTGGSSTGGSGATTPTTETPKPETPSTGAPIAKTEEKTDVQGNKIVTVTDINGKEASSVELSDTAVKEAAETGKPVEIAVPTVKPTEDKAAAPTVSISLPKDVDKAPVSIPVAEADNTTVLMKVNEDGTLTPVVMSVLSEDGTGMVATVEEGNYVVVENKVSFSDVQEDAWYESGVNFTASHGLMVGTGEGKFDQQAPLTTAQTAAVIGRMKGEGTSESWEKAVEKFGNNEINNRQNTISMLYEAYKELGGAVTTVDTGKVESFNDADAISAENMEAVRWAIEMGLINGVGEGRIDPMGELTRGQFSTMIERFVKLVQGVK